MEADLQDRAVIAVISALAIERRPLDALVNQMGASIGVYQCGIGQNRAYDAAHAALSSGAAGLVSWGVAGSLAPGDAPGTVLLPREVITRDGEIYATDLRWVIGLTRALQPMFAVQSARLLSTDDALYTKAQKLEAGHETGACAVDMESAAIAKAAARARTPFVVIRVVLDTVADTLPPGIDRLVDEAGNRRSGAVFGVALRPLHWPSLLRVAARYRQASRSLRDIAEILGAERFLYPGFPVTS